MPEISRFFGIVISMFYSDHPPPHFHARYGGSRILVDIDTLGVLRGDVPPRVLGMITEWAAFAPGGAAGELETGAGGAAPGTIAPLE